MKRRKPRFFLPVLLILATVAFFDARYFEPRYPILKTYNVEVANLPRNLDGFKVVQLSDIHRRRIVPDVVIRRAVNIANSTHADVALLTGDYVGKERENIPVCARMLASLKTRLGSYAVLGNHDHWTGAIATTRAFRSKGITVLDNSSAKLEKGLYVAGVDDLWTGPSDGAAALRKVPLRSACFMLSHQPNGVSQFGGRNGLLLTGHTHGGQVNLPPIPRNLLPGLLGAKYIKGWYREGETLMYVNRGIGMINPPVRFLARPEVTLFILHPSKDGKTRVVD